MKELLEREFEAHELTEYTDETTGEVFKTVAPQAIINRLNEVFGIGSAKLVVTNRIFPDGKDFVGAPTKVGVSATGCLHIRNGLVNWVSSERTKGFLVKEGEATGNAINACESMLWASCARELGIGGYLYFNEATRSIAPKKKDGGSLATKDALKKAEASKDPVVKRMVTEAPIEPPVKPQEDDRVPEPTQGAVLTNYELVKAQDNLAKALIKVKDLFDVERELIESHIQLEEGKRLTIPKLLEWVTNYEAGVYNNEVEEKPLFDDDHDEGEAPDFGEEEQEEQENDGEEDFSAFIREEPLPAAQGRPIFMGLMAAPHNLTAGTYEDFITSKFGELPDERLSFGKFSQFGTEDFIEELKAYL